MKLLKRDSMSSRVDEMERVIHFLRSGSDIEASTILARLRLGQRIEDIAKGFPTVSLPPSAGAPPWYVLDTHHYHRLHHPHSSTREYKVNLPAQLTSL
jgi:hypothetical protein